MASKKRHVKIHLDRGYGKGMFMVQASRGIGPGEEVQLKSLEDGAVFWICRAHTWRDGECMRADITAARSVGAPA